jgi:hypothetical protein
MRAITPPRRGKGHYTELETAHALGLSLEELRALIRKRVLRPEEAGAHAPMNSFQPADIILLQMLRNVDEEERLLQA